VAGVPSASSLAWNDYNSAVTFAVSTTLSTSSQRWSIGNSYSTALLTIGGGNYSPSSNYYHQYSITPYYTVSDASTVTVTNVVNYTQFSSILQATPTLGSNGGTAVWANSGSSITYVSPIAGGSGERWQIALGDTNAHITVASLSSSGPITSQYYHQYSITFGYGNQDSSVITNGNLIGSYYQFASSSNILSGSTYGSTSPVSAYVDAGNNKVSYQSVTSGGQIWTLSPSPVSYIVSSSTTISNSNYHHNQYLVSFIQTGIDSSAGTNTVLTVGGTTYTYNSLPTNVWINNGTTFSWASPVSGGVGKQFTLTGSSGSSPIITSGTYSATYKTVAITKAGVDTSATGTSTYLTWSHTLLANSNRMVVVYLSAEHNGITISEVTYGGNAMTLATSYETGTTTRMMTQIWYILEANLPANGARTVAISADGYYTTQEISAYCAEYAGVKQSAPEATNGVAQISGNTITNTISPSSNSWALSVMGCGNIGTWAAGGSQVQPWQYSATTSCTAVAELQGANGQTTLASTFTGTVNRMVRVCASFQPAP